MSYASPSVSSSGLSGIAAYANAGVNGLLEALIAANTSAAAAPGQPSGVAASGGTLPSATYYVVCTGTNGMGETTASPVSAGIAANAQKITVTIPSHTGNTGVNVYIGTSSTGPFMLAATGVTAGTQDITALPANSWASANPPTANSTGIVTDGNPAKMQAIRSVERGNFDAEWKRLVSEVSAFYRGEPVPFQSVVQKVRNLHAAVALYGQLLAEIGAVIDANPGSLKPSTTPIGNSKTVRTFP